MVIADTKREDNILANKGKENNDEDNRMMVMIEVAEGQ